MRNLPIVVQKSPDVRRRMNRKMEGARARTKQTMFQAKRKTRTARGILNRL